MESVAKRLFLNTQISDYYFRGMIYDLLTTLTYQTYTHSYIHVSTLTDIHIYSALRMIALRHIHEVYPRSTRLWHCTWLTTHTRTLAYILSMVKQHAVHASSALLHNQVSLIIVGGYLPGGVVNEKWFSKQVAYCRWQPAEPCDLMFRGIHVGCR